MLHIFLAMVISGNLTIESFTGDSMNNSISGFTVFDDKLNINLKIKGKINQEFIYAGDTMILYYPDEQKVLYFPHYNPMKFPVTHMILGSKSNFNLSSLGYRFLKKEKVKDTLNTYWVPEKNPGKIWLHLKIVKKRLKSIIIEKEGNILVKTLYEEYMEKGNFSIPTGVKSYSFLQKPVVKEYIKLSNIKFIAAFPESLKRTRIPSDAEVEKW